MQKYIINIPEDYNIASRDLPELSIRAQLGNMKPFHINTGLKMEIYDESPAEQRGAEKAWELAKKIGGSCNKGNMTPSELKSCFGVDKICMVFDSLSYAEATAKFEAWAERKIQKEDADTSLKSQNCWEE